MTKNIQLPHNQNSLPDLKLHEFRAASDNLILKTSLLIDKIVNLEKLHASLAESHKSLVESMNAYNKDLLAPILCRSLRDDVMFILVNCLKRIIPKQWLDVSNNKDQFKKQINGVAFRIKSLLSQRKGGISF